MRRARLSRLLAPWVLLGLALTACETAPIVRGTGSEHWQSLRVGLPF